MISIWQLDFVPNYPMLRNFFVGILLSTYIPVNGRTPASIVFPRNTIVTTRATTPAPSKYKEWFRRSFRRHRDVLLPTSKNSFHSGIASMGFGKPTGMENLEELAPRCGTEHRYCKKYGNFCRDHWHKWTPQKLLQPTSTVLSRDVPAQD